MDIAVIFTGGTIGSRTDSEGWIAPDREQSYVLIDRFREKYPELAETVQFDCSMPYRILSENLNTEYICKLVSAVGQALNSGRYDGIVICHGSDTLQYSATVLGLLYPEAGIPVLLVASNYPLEDPQANGIANFHAAVTSIVKRQLKGVLVPYRNSDGRIYLHCGTGLLAHRTYDDELYSMHDEYLGYYDQDGLWHEKEDHTALCTGLPGCHPQLSVLTSGMPHNIRHPAVLRFTMCPGYVWPEIPEGTEYIMVESYHSGTVCVDDAWKTFLEKAKERGIPVYLTGLDRIQGGYETMKQYSAMELRCMVNVPPITCYCYLWLKSLGLLVGEPDYLW